MFVQEPHKNNETTYKPQVIVAYMSSWAKEWDGAWGFKGEAVIYRMIRKADVWSLNICSVMQLGHSDKSYLW